MSFRYITRTQTCIFCSKWFRCWVFLWYLCGPTLWKEIVYGLAKCIDITLHMKGILPSPWYFLSFCIKLTYVISHVDVWLYETVDSQHVLKVVFSSLLSEALPRFAADSTKPASLLRSSSLQNTYIINTAGALRIVPSNPSVLLFASKKLLLENSLYFIVTSTTIYA